jgi:uncharacterized protein (DUF1800 family)
MLAQEDPDPNSPTPILLSEEDSTRALAVHAEKQPPTKVSKASSGFFWPNQRVELFVANLSLMEGESANAFRVYMKDGKGREYRLPLLEIRPADHMPGVYSVVIRLTDEIRYWPTPTADGDVLIRLTWRGLTSNSVRLAYGGTGGKIQDEKGAVPTPLSSVQAKSEGDGQTNELIGYRWSGDRARFLQQATFGSTPALDSRLRRIGLKTWLAEQFEAQYPSVSNPYPNFANKSVVNQNAEPPAGCGAVNTPDPATYSACIRDHYTMYPIQTWFFREAFYGEPQLKHRVAWSLAQIWVISGVDTQQSSHMITYHKLLSAHAFGSYRQLMRDMTLNPGMGNYLDMMRSTKNNPNENYPREILQLFTIGLYLMNQDGTLQLNDQGNPIPTYDQNTINNFTKVFTGWRDCRTLSAACPNQIAGVSNYTDPMELAPANHDVTVKTLLSYPGSTTTNVPACSGCTNAAITTYAYNSLDQALDNIFNHPNVAPFVSRLMIQHLVTSDPTPAYVGRVAAVFNNNGLGTRGDMKAVVRAILLDPEARGDLKTDINYGKLREPVELITNVLKAFDVKNAALTGPSDGVVQNLSSALLQNPFLAPTVFNYYPPDYVIPGTALNGPEFGIMTTGTAVGRANFANTMVYGQININLPNTPAGTRIDLAEMQALAAADATGNLLLDALDWRLMHGRMSADMRSKILTAVLAEPAGNTLQRARAAIYLVATSSQFQIQR